MGTYLTTRALLENLSNKRFRMSLSTYPSELKVTCRRFPRGTFNSDGYVLNDARAVGKPEQQTISYVRQPVSNLVLSTTDALNRQTTYTYDAQGNVTSITRLAGTPNAVTSRFAYEPAFNQLTAISDPLGHTTTFAYDNQGNRIASVDAVGNVTSTACNSAGQPISVTDA